MLRRDDQDMLHAANQATYHELTGAGIVPGAARQVKMGRPYADGDAVVKSRWASPARLDVLSRLGRELRGREEQ